MNRFKFVTLIVVSVVIAVLLATALANFTRVSDSALAEVATPRANAGAGSSRPSTTGTNYLPIIFLNSATAGGAWLLGGNAGTNSLTDFLGTTDNMTLTLRVSNTVAYRIVPAVDPGLGFAPNLIGGSPDNRVSTGLYGATIAGGGLHNTPNVITGTGNYATIGGGYFNTASGLGASVGGGLLDFASGSEASVGGGIGNTASGLQATVGGGYFNTASSGSATVGGGNGNNANGDYATVGGGWNNTASGVYATIPGGNSNVASGNWSFAAGTQARAIHGGAFVWADSNQVPFASTAPDQFLVRASGGITLYTNAAASVGASLYSGSGSWNTLSNKNLKTNFAEVDSRAILERASELPIMTWNYKTQEVSIRHIGPMAQDFAAAFNVGENDTTISTVDAQGVALAAIQGLAQENKELKARVSALEASQSQNALSLNALAPWAMVGLVAVWAIRRGRGTEDGRRGRDEGE